MAEKHLKKGSTSFVIGGNANQNDPKIPPHIHIRMTKIKTSSTAHAGEDVEQGEHSSIAGGSANLGNHFGTEFSDFSESW